MYEGGDDAEEPQIKMKGERNQKVWALYMYKQTLGQRGQILHGHTSGYNKLQGGIVPIFRCASITGIHPVEWVSITE